MDKKGRENYKQITKVNNNNNYFYTDRRTKKNEEKKKKAYMKMHG